ncbi:MAG TPA: hypothetical protein VHD63_05755 [Ktedonobacteraceae bacterium]|jgi:hypothetical protein|nr:hypothetical protein [Ktedonobacteraceae bacterium]
MAQDRDQYLQFTIKLLKGSFALSALWQDALNYHMIDQPEKLIAMRLTEYYELIARGTLRPGPSAVGTPNPPAPPSIAPAGNTPAPPSLPASNPSGRMATPLPPVNNNFTPRSASPQPLEEVHLNHENDIVTRSSALVVEQNADDAADYWSPL